MRASSRDCAPSASTWSSNRCPARCATCLAAPSLSEQGQRQHLHVVPGAVVVRLNRLVTSVVALQQPVEELRHPVHQVLLVLVRPRRRRSQQSDGIDEKADLRRVDDADAASLAAPGDALGVLQVRVHPCLWIEEPGAQQQAGARGEVLVVAEEESRRQRVDGAEHRCHGLSIVLFAIWIGLAVAAHPWQAGVDVWVRPPVGRLAEVVMGVTARRRRVFVYHRKGADGAGRLCILQQPLIRCRQYGVAVVHATTRCQQRCTVEQENSRPGLRCRLCHGPSRVRPQVASSSSDAS